MSIKDCLDDVMERLERAFQKSARKGPNLPQILPVSKGQNIEKLTEALAVPGFPKRLGENYFQELQEKAEILQNVEWHFIGKIQSRKLAEIQSVSRVIHSVSRKKELELLSAKTLFYVQVNVSGEEEKNGVDESELEELLSYCESAKIMMNFLGFMGMPAPLEAVGEADVRKQFSELRRIRDYWAPTKKLNMGMSSDFEIAIEEGSDLVRIGTLLFGARTTSTK